uniref:ELYS-like domain-containing protein n=1 Tax=Glossina pallidipes TaxID=7398 RepID=A0A1B0A055_GLOPL
MEWYEIEVDGKHTVKFDEVRFPTYNSSEAPALIDGNAINAKKIGGILHHDKWAWLARNNVLQIIALHSAHTICTYEFSELHGYENCCIKCVEELFHNNFKSLLLAVVLESYRITDSTASTASYISVFSLETKSVLSTIELSLHITCARFVGPLACRRTLLQNFDGCLAVGSEEGALILLGMNRPKIMLFADEEEVTFVPCQIVDYNLPLTEIHRHFRNCQKEGIHLGLQVEAFDNPCSIKSLLPLDVSMGLAVGLEDGRLLCYDLAELQIYYVVQPPSGIHNLVKMDYLEPLDDPRPCFYILALYDNGQNLHALLHTLMFEKRLRDEEASHYFEIFQNGAISLKLPLEETNCIALTCQSIATINIHNEEESKRLFAISWHSIIDEKNKLLLFDLNQWYKDEMPCAFECNQQPNYLAGYILNGCCNGLQTWLSSTMMRYFNSVQRFEEHFYPNALSFDCCLLHTNGSRRYIWEGVQNRIINVLRSSSASIFLDPNVYFNKIIEARLTPQFTELNLNFTYSRNAKYEVILSVALEQNCFKLLRDCAKCWKDGSFLGSQTASTGLSLSTLTDWIWRRATDIKNRCNSICTGFFQYAGYNLGQRERKELTCITRQLKLLGNLLEEVFKFSLRQIPGKVLYNLEKKHKSILMTCDYQNVLIGFLDIGLLPKASFYNNSIEGAPYPYKQLKEDYKTKRSFFGKISENYLVKKTGACRLLYIDALIEHECQSNVLREYWLEDQGDGLYPPSRIEAILRVMLLPDMHYEHKCAILLYFFLDLNMAIEEELYMSVFKISKALIKTVQSFWNLDHGHLTAAVDGFASAVGTNEGYSPWLVELLIEALLCHRSSNKALRILQSQSYIISPSLKLRTLLANRRISEAFKYVRSKNDDILIQLFFNSCLHNGQFDVICGLALNEKEDLLLQDILKKSKLCGAKSLHFVYLLQKSKYVEAISYMNELAKDKSSHVSDRVGSLVDTPNLMLSAMAPVTQSLTDVYFKIKNKIEQKEFNSSSPLPLSCQLIKQNASNLLGGIYHSSVLRAHFASYYSGEMKNDQRQYEAAQVMNRNNASFFRRPQNQTHTQGLRTQNNISYPQVYKPTAKRRYVENDLYEDALLLDRGNSDIRGNPNKRRCYEVMEELSDITQSQRRSRQTNITNCNFTAIEGDDDISSSNENEEAENFLKETLVTGKRTEIMNTTEKQPLIEIQSILKSTKEEEKHLRNNIPHLTFLVEEDKQKENATTISVDSSEEFDDDFYSPLLSPQSSNQSFNQSSKPDIVNSQTYLTGPQPRKPLARLSTESSEKCKPTDSSKTGPYQTDLIYTFVPGRLQKITLLTDEKLTSDLSDIDTLSPKVCSDDLLLHNRRNGSSGAATTTNEKCEFNIFASQETATNVVAISTCDPNAEMLASSKYSLTNESSISVKSSTTETLASKVSSFKLVATVCKENSAVIPDNTTSNSESNTNNSKKFTVGQESETMETTLGMTTFDLSILDTTTADQCQPSLAITPVEEENVVKSQLRDSKVIMRNSLEEDMGVEQSVCEARKMEVKTLSPLIGEFGKLQQTGDNESPKNEDYIVLSSSCSSSSLPIYNKQDEELCQSLDQQSCNNEKERLDDFNTKNIKEANTNKEELMDTYEYEENAIDYEYSDEEVLSTNENDSNEFVDFIGDSSHSMLRNKPEKSEDGDSNDYIEVDEQSFEKCDASEHVSISSVEEEGEKVQADQVSLPSDWQEYMISCHPTSLKQKEIESNQLAQTLVSSRESQSSKLGFPAHEEEEENTSSQEPMITCCENDDQQPLTLNPLITIETIMPSKESISLTSEIDIQINEHMATSTLPTDDVVQPLLDFESMAEVVDRQISEHPTTSTLGTERNVQELSEVDKVVALNPSNIIKQEITVLRSCQLVNAETVNETPEKKSESDGEIAQNSEVDGTKITKKEAEIIKEKSFVACEVEQKSNVKIEELAEAECVDKVSLKEKKFAQNSDCETESTGTEKTDAMVQTCPESLASFQTYPTDMPIAIFSESTVSMKKELVSSKDVENQEDKVNVKMRIKAIQEQIDSSAAELSMSSSLKRCADDSTENIKQAEEPCVGFDNERKALLIENIQNSKLKQEEKREETDESIKTPVTAPRILRGSSEPAEEKANNTSNISVPYNRAKRGMSLPPQSQGITADVTPFALHKLNYHGERDNERGNINSPHTKFSDNKNNEGVENSNSSSPQSNLMVPMLEGPLNADSPSARTRSRTRRTSTSSNTSELPHALKRARSDSVSSQTESISSTKSRDRRVRNVMSMQEETESMPGFPKQADAKGSSQELKRQQTQSPLPMITRKRRAHSLVSLKEEEIESRPESRKSTGTRDTSSDIAPFSESGLAYSSARRLTRNQLAVLEKSKKLAQIFKKGIQAETEMPYTPTQTQTQTPGKQLRKTGSNRSITSLQQESDDNESIISKRSTTSSVGHRRSGSAMKKNEGIEDDQISVTSSMDSETRNTPYKLRSKGKSLSINTLQTITENSNIEYFYTSVDNSCNEVLVTLLISKVGGRPGLTEPLVSRATTPPPPPNVDKQPFEIGLGVGGVAVAGLIRKEELNVVKGLKLPCE